MTTLRNPGRGRDYVVTLAHRLTVWSERDCRVRLRYVPDRWLLDPSSLAAYLRHVATEARGSLEQAALAVLDDVSNEVVPRWLEVELTMPHRAAGHADDSRTAESEMLAVMAGQASSGEPSVCLQRVLVSDRQPGWENPPLLARLMGESGPTE